MCCIADFANVHGWARGTLTLVPPPYAYTIGSVASYPQLLMISSSPPRPRRGIKSESTGSPAEPEPDLLPSFASADAALFGASRTCGPTSGHPAAGPGILPGPARIHGGMGQSHSGFPPSPGHSPTTGLAEGCGGINQVDAVP
jgi:hypothetical protein